MKLVGRIPRSSVSGGALARVPYPPFDVLVSQVGSEVCAIEDACNHAGASLCEGIRSGDRIVCPMHGYVFELKTGALLQPRGLCGDQRRFVAVVEGDEIVVWDPVAIVIDHGSVDP
jgi:nitrite reductase/ring-hydroxylating ferredoxin subunit